tara:strand:- start:62 stop:217 length:156 start_codon:yes stop_codon:yes gene_type:complete
MTSKAQKTFDEYLNPKGDFSKPSLERLREGVILHRKIKAKSPNSGKGPAPA